MSDPPFSHDLAPDSVLAEVGVVPEPFRAVVLRVDVERVRQSVPRLGQVAEVVYTGP
jgi:hypothetical protein